MIPGTQSHSGDGVACECNPVLRVSSELGIISRTRALLAQGSIMYTFNLADVFSPKQPVSHSTS